MKNEEWMVNLSVVEPESGGPVDAVADSPIPLSSLYEATYLRPSTTSVITFKTQLSRYVCLVLSPPFNRLIPCPLPNTRLLAPPLPRRPQHLIQRHPQRSINTLHSPRRLSLSAPAPQPRRPPRLLQPQTLRRQPKQRALKCKCKR